MDLTAQDDSSEGNDRQAGVDEIDASPQRCVRMARDPRQGVSNVIGSPVVDGAPCGPTDLALLDRPDADEVANLIVVKFKGKILDACSHDVKEQIAHTDRCRVRVSRSTGYFFRGS
jgi:hypothetical protein